VRALGAVTIIVFAFIFVLFDGIGKHPLGFVDLHPDFWKIGQLHRRTILVDQAFDIKPVKEQVVVLYHKIFLRKVEGLVHQVGVTVIHQLIMSCHWRKICANVIDANKKPGENFRPGF
jgi:hypothetical protein